MKGKPKYATSIQFANVILQHIYPQLHIQLGYIKVVFLQYLVHILFVVYGAVALLN